MKKILLIITLCIISFASYSQVYMSGTFNFQNEFESKELKLGIGTEFGFHVSPKNALGFEVLYTYVKDYRRILTLSPYYRHLFGTGQVCFFTDVAFGLTGTFNEGDDEAVWGIKAGIIPGLEIKLTEHCSLLSKIGFLGYYQPDDSKKYLRLGFDFSDIKIGFIYNF